MIVRCCLLTWCWCLLMFAFLLLRNCGNPSVFFVFPKTLDGLRINWERAPFQNCNVSFLDTAWPHYVEILRKRSGQTEGKSAIKSWRTGLNSSEDRTPWKLHTGKHDRPVCPLDSCWPAVMSMAFLIASNVFTFGDRFTRSWYTVFWDPNDEAGRRPSRKASHETMLCSRSPGWLVA